MSEKQALEERKVTVVGQSTHEETTKETDVTGVGNEPVTVVNEPLFTYWIARLKQRLRKRHVLAFAFAIVALAGYVVGWLQFAGSTMDQASSIQADSNTKFTDFSNHDLRNKGLGLASDLRKLLLQCGVEDKQLTDVVLAQMASAKPEQQQEIWLNYNAASDLLLQRLRTKFATRFSHQAGLVRMELLSRISGRRPDADMDYLYAQAGTPAEIRLVMADLADLSESLWRP